MEKKLKLTEKLGIKIVLIAVISIIVLVSGVLGVTIVSFDIFTAGILIERANTGIAVLGVFVNEEVGNLYNKVESVKASADYAAAFAEKNNAAFQNLWTSSGSDPDGEFQIAADADGNILFTSPASPFRSFDFSKVRNGGTVNGIVSTDGCLAAVCASQVNYENASGIIVSGFRLDSSGWMESVKSMAGCELSVYAGSTLYSSTIGSSVTGSSMTDAARKAVIDGKSSYSGNQVINGVEYYVAYEPIYDVNGAVVGGYFVGSDATVATKEFASVSVVATLIGVIGAFVIAGVIFAFCRKRVTVPLGYAEEYANEILAGQLSTTNVTYKFHHDEVGLFVETLQSAKQGMNDVVGDSSRILAAMANSDFTEMPSVDYPGVFEEIKRNILKIEDDIGAALRKINDSSELVMSGSGQMSEGSQSLADGTTRQASAIQQISATIAEVSEQISNTAQNAAEAGDLSKMTQNKVNQQDDRIKSMVGAMEEISSTSQEIEKIIKTIEDIAFQTNILALNAAVEAARAGDAGKGFAVVADEVRNLSGKSDEAAKSTSSLIRAAIEAVDNGSKIAFATAESMKEVKDMSSQTASLIDRIATASAEQNQSIRQINSGIEQISQVIQTNSATAEETAASCEELSGQSKLLKEQVSRFNINS